MCRTRVTHQTFYSGSVASFVPPIDRLLSPKARKNPTSLSSNSWWSKTVDGILFFLIRFASQPYFIKLNAINASKNELDKLTILIFRPKVDAYVEKCIVSDSRQIFTNLNLDYGCELATSPV